MVGVGEMIRLAAYGETVPCPLLLCFQIDVESRPYGKGLTGIQQSEYIISLSSYQFDI